MSYTLSHIQAELGRRSLKRFLADNWDTVEPGRAFISNWHLDAICDHLEALYKGEIRNLLITLPPRMTKSLTCSVAFPAWAWLQDPTTQFLCASYSMDLATRDNVKTRRIIESQFYQSRYIDTLPPDSKLRFELSGDQNQKTKFENTRYGYRQAVSVESQVTGYGADILVGDDLHNAAEYQSEANIEKVIEWNDNAWTSRLNDAKTGRKLIIMQRVSHKDIAGHVLKQGGYVHLNLPMWFVPEKKCYTSIGFEDPRTEAGELLCPARVDEEALIEMKRRMSRYAIASQLQQEPSPDEGGIYKKAYWVPWGDRPMPDCAAIVQVWDTALEDKEENDYSACTTWGIFEHTQVLGEEWGKRKGEEETRYCMIILDSYKKRLQGPDLRQEALRLYRQRRPDCVIIERRASGHGLLHELRRANVPVLDFNPGTNNKVARANIAAIVFEQGCVFYPPRQWAEEVIETCARFPNDDFDDITDTVTMAALYLRKKFWIQYQGENEEDDMPPEPPMRGFYD